MYVGDKGIMLRDRLIPDKKWAEFGRPPRKLPRSPGHWKEWLDACRGGKPAGSNFPDHAAHLAEIVLLGNIAIRMNQKLEWDAVNMKFPSCPEADKFVNPTYRQGFALASADGPGVMVQPETVDSAGLLELGLAMV
jgi:hypothetical protein